MWNSGNAPCSSIISDNTLVEILLIGTIILYIIRFVVVVKFSLSVKYNQLATYALRRRP